MRELAERSEAARTSAPQSATSARSADGCSESVREVEAELDEIWFYVATEGGMMSALPSD